MIKDSFQKQKAMRYCVAMGYVPYMEAVVRFAADVAERPFDITDVDVLGIRPASEMPERRVVFDCKTTAKLSGVGRAMWAAGLREMVDADEAFVILLKAAPEGHRLAAAGLKVRLFSEERFDQYAKAATINYVEGVTYLDNLPAWEKLYELGRNTKGLSSLTNFLTSEAPFERDAPTGFRALLSRLKQAEGEFDVTKPEHKMLYGVVISQLLVFLGAATRTFHDAFDPAMEKAKFESALRNFIYGGREGFALRQKLHQAIHQGREGEVTPFQLPGWDRFVEMQRSMLDAPFLAGAAALPVKDLAFREVCSPLELADRRILLEFTSSGRARQFAMQANRYIGSLSRLLKECSDHYAALLSNLPDSPKAPNDEPSARA